MILIVIIFLILISLILSILSLYGEIEKSTKPKEITDELSKGRVIFHANTKQIESE